MDALSRAVADAGGSRDDAAFPVPAEEIERVDAPSADEFVRKYVRRSRPVVLRGLTRDWLPLAEWTLPRVAARYGSARVITARLAGGTLFDDAKTGVVFERVVLGDFIESLAAPGTAANYVMAPVWNLPASLGDDYRLPEYCRDARHLRVKFWIGKGGTVTPVHRDVPHNLHVHLVGRKRWLLFPPGESSKMYPRGLFSGMPNFAHVDPERPDDPRHPRFRGARALGAVVGPGETLFIPHGWWHHTRTLDDAVSMNFWWGGRVIELASRASALFKRARRIRQDEWG